MSASVSEPESDGRRRRGLDNRARIVAAMLDLIREGQATPSAEQVALRADVGLRTVFRHFQDMDSLYRQMSVAIESELRGIMLQPFRSERWEDRLYELIERRAEGFERIAPFRNASAAVRHRSAFLASDHDRLSRALREVLVRNAPGSIPPERLEALDLLLSYEGWSRLRREQGLSPARAREVLEATVRKLMS